MGPKFGAQKGNKLGSQLGPMSIIKLSPNWACQMGPIHCPKFLLPGMRFCVFKKKFIAGVASTYFNTPFFSANNSESNAVLHDTIVCSFIFIFPTHKSLVVVLLSGWPIGAHRGPSDPSGSLAPSPRRFLQFFQIFAMGCVNS